jgi:hypothetical protein
MTGEVELVAGTRLHPVAGLGIGSEPGYLTPSLLVKKIVSAEGSMARDIFTVVLLDQQWMVRFRGRHSQRYAPQGEAICAAVEAANKTGMANPDGAQVRVQDSNNVFRTDGPTASIHLRYADQAATSGSEAGSAAVARLLVKLLWAWRSRHHFAICRMQYQARAANEAAIAEPPRTTRPRRPQVMGSFRRCQISGLVRRPACLSVAPHPGVSTETRRIGRHCPNQDNAAPPKAPTRSCGRFSGER